MKAEIITIGDEILIGQTIDTNSAWLSRELNKIDIDVYQITSISDTKEHIIRAMDEAGSRADLILITGGLGPTRDDITKYTLTEYFNTKLVFNEEVFENIKSFLSGRSIPINELNRNQAEIPETARIFQNKNGTAPGLWFESNGKVFISMPGVPHEMKALMKEQILTEISNYFGISAILHKTILTFGTYEARLAEILTEFERSLPGNIKTAYLPEDGIIKIRLTAKGTNKTEVTAQLGHATRELYRIIPDYIFGTDEDTLEQIIGSLLKSEGSTLSTAESCTGGRIAHLITSIPGSSDYYTGSVIAYSNEVKERILNVDPKLIEKHGAVSREVVEAMAEGVRRYLTTDYAVATSGIAGPEGGTVKKPVGTTWIAVAKNNKIISKKFLFGNDRTRNIRRSSLASLNMLRKLILDEEI
jgi:nicotinamide-nucleotide amidase